jgi:hypothetical protein
LHRGRQQRRRIIGSSTVSLCCCACRRGGGHPYWTHNGTPPLPLTASSSTTGGGSTGRGVACRRARIRRAHRRVRPAPPQRRCSRQAHAQRSGSVRPTRQTPPRSAAVGRGGRTDSIPPEEEGDGRVVDNDDDVGGEDKDDATPSRALQRDWRADAIG